MCCERHVWSFTLLLFFSFLVIVFNYCPHFIVIGFLRLSFFGESNNGLNLKMRISDSQRVYTKI